MNLFGKVLNITDVHLYVKVCKQTKAKKKQDESVVFKALCSCYHSTFIGGGCIAYINVKEKHLLLLPFKNLVVEFRFLSLQWKEDMVLFIETNYICCHWSSFKTCYSRAYY